MTQPAPPPPTPAPVAPAPQSQSAEDAFKPPKPVNTSAIVIPGATQVASAPQTPRPDISPENVGGGGSPTYAFPSPTFPDALTLPAIGAFA